MSLEQPIEPTYFFLQRFDVGPKLIVDLVLPPFPCHIRYAKRLKCLDVGSESFTHRILAVRPVPLSPTIRIGISVRASSVTILFRETMAISRPGMKPGGMGWSAIRVWSCSIDFGTQSQAQAAMNAQTLHVEYRAASCSPGQGRNRKGMIILKGLYS